MGNYVPHSMSSQPTNNHTYTINPTTQLHQREVERTVKGYAS